MILFCSFVHLFFLFASFEFILASVCWSFDRFTRNSLVNNCFHRRFMYVVECDVIKRGRSILTYLSVKINIKYMIILIKILFKRTHKIKKNLHIYFPCDSYFSLLYFTAGRQLSRQFIDILSIIRVQQPSSKYMLQKYPSCLSHIIPAFSVEKQLSLLPLLFL